MAWSPYGNCRGTFQFSERNSRLPNTGNEASEKWCLSWNGTDTVANTIRSGPISFKRVSIRRSRLYYVTPRYRLTHGNVNGRCVSGFMFGLGDIIAQSAVEKRKANEIDWLRTVRYASIGCAVGPTLSMWYRTLDRFGTKNTVPVLAKKLLVDQLIASPIINGSVMIMSRVFSGDEWPQIRKKLEDNYVTVMLNSYLVKLLSVLFYFIFLIQLFCTALAGRTSWQLHTCSAAVQGFGSTDSIIGLEYICFIYECWRRKRIVQRSIINLQNLTHTETMNWFTIMN